MSKTLAGDPSFCMEEAAPKDGETARFRVIVDLPNLMDATDDKPAPPSRPTAAAAAEIAQQTLPKMRWPLCRQRVLKLFWQKLIDLPEHST